MRTALLLSLARHQPNARKATTNGIIGAMRKDGFKLAFRLVLRFCRA